MVKEISLIIPSQNAEAKLLNLIGSIQNWEIIPNEIIIVDSSEVKPCMPEEFKRFVKKFELRLSIIFEKNLYPGHARNIGISNSTNNLLAFLDTSTMPCNKWLSSTVLMLNVGNIYKRNYLDTKKDKRSLMVKK